MPDCPDQQLVCPWGPKEWKEFGKLTENVKAHHEKIDAMQIEISIAAKNVSLLIDSVERMDMKLDGALDRWGNGRSLKTYGTLTAGGAGGGALTVLVYEWGHRLVEFLFGGK